MTLRTNTGNATKGNNQASIAVLFSVVLAALYHDHVPLYQPIDLINVAFETAIATATPTVHSSLELSPLNNSKLDCDNPFSLSPDRRAAHYYLTWLVDTGLADCDLRLACTIATYSTAVHVVMVSTRRVSSRFDSSIVMKTEIGRRMHCQNYLEVLS
jgi:hypothetical protein